MNILAKTGWAAFGGSFEALGGSFQVFQLSESRIKVRRWPYAGTRKPRSLRI